MERATVVIGRAAEIVELEDRQRTRHGHVSLGPKSNDLVVGRKAVRREVEINETVRTELGIERNSQQAALARRVGVHRHKRVRKQHALFDYPHLTRLLANK